MTQNVILNLKSPQAMQTDVAFTQGDYGEAKLTIAVKDNEQYITGDIGASISFLRADGNIVTGDLTGTKGMYAYTFKGNELEAAGKIVATVTIKYTGGRVSAAAFAFTVRYNPTYDRKIPAGPYITELEKIKEQAQSYVEYLSALIEQLQPDIGSTALTKADLINGYTQTVAGIKAFDAAAAKTLKELVDGKIDATKIVNNLLSTDASMVLSAALGPIIDQRLTDLLEKYNRLNGKSFGVNPSSPGFPWGLGTCIYKQWKSVRYCSWRLLLFSDYSWRSAINRRTSKRCHYNYLAFCDIDTIVKWRDETVILSIWKTNQSNRRI